MKTIKVSEISNGKELFESVLPFLQSESVCLDFSDYDGFLGTILSVFFRMLYVRFDEKTIENNLSLVSDRNEINQMFKKAMKLEIARLREGEYKPEINSAFARQLLEEPDQWKDGMIGIHVVRDDQKDLKFVGIEIACEKRITIGADEYLICYSTQTGKYVINKKTENRDAIVVNDLCDEKIFEFCGYSPWAKRFYKQCGIEYSEYI